MSIAGTYLCYRKTERYRLKQQVEPGCLMTSKKGG